MTPISKYSKLTEIPLHAFLRWHDRWENCPPYDRWENYPPKEQMRVGFAVFQEHLLRTKLSYHFRPERKTFRAHGFNIGRYYGVLAEGWNTQLDCAVSRHLVTSSSWCTRFCILKWRHEGALPGTCFLLRLSVSEGIVSVFASALRAFIRTHNRALRVQK